jgi:hypothetical protein
MSNVKTYGPFVHTLNRGGLREILVTSKLRGSVASNHLANDSAAVRAYVGSFEYQQRNKNWHGHQSTHIEFLSFIPPAT